MNTNSDHLAQVSGSDATARDAARYRWLWGRLLAADFAWGDPPQPVLVFAWPKDVPVSGNCNSNIDAAIADDAGAQLSEPAAPVESNAVVTVSDKPYAYEFGRSNGDGTYSVVIERGDMVQVGRQTWESGPPRDPHPDHPVNPLYEHPAPAASPAPTPEEPSASDFAKIMRATDGEQVLFRKGSDANGDPCLFQTTSIDDMTAEIAISFKSGDWDALDAAFDNADADQADGVRSAAGSFIGGPRA